MTCEPFSRQNEESPGKSGLAIQVSVNLETYTCTTSATKAITRNLMASRPVLPVLPAEKAKRFVGTKLTMVAVRYPKKTLVAKSK